MSLLSSAVYANPTTPIWAMAGSGGGSTGPTGPTGSAGSGPTGPTGPSPKAGLPSQQFECRLPQGTNGGTAPAGNAWFIRPLTGGIPALDGSGNSSTITGMSLNPSTYEITVPEGTYLVSGCAGGVMITEQARLYSDGISTNILLGTSVGNDSRTTYSTFTGTIVGPDTVSAQFNGLISSGAFDWGQASGVDEEVYVQVQFTKIA